VNFSVATFSCAFFRPWSTIDAFYRSRPPGSDGRSNPPVNVEPRLALELAFGG
jgi:hypothetical protein